MKRMRCFVAASSLILVFAGHGHGQTESKTLANVLMDTLDMEDFQQPMTLKEALGLFYEKFAAKNKELPILVNVNAFKREDPDSKESIYDTPIRFPPYPRHMPLRTALRVALGNIPVKADFVLRGGAVEVVPASHTTTAKLLEMKVLGQYTNVPVEIVLDDLSEQTGASIAVHPRIGEGVNTKVSVLFRNDVTLEGALRLVTEMAELKLVVLPSGILITTPEHAKLLDKR